MAITNRDDVLRAVGAWCRQKRIRAGDQITDVAGRLNIDPSVVSRFERGQINSLYYAYSYSKMYGGESHVVDQRSDGADVERSEPHAPVGIGEGRVEDGVGSE